MKYLSQIYFCRSLLQSCRYSFAVHEGLPLSPSPIVHYVLFTGLFVSSISPLLWILCLSMLEISCRGIFSPYWDLCYTIYSPYRNPVLQNYSHHPSVHLRRTFSAVRW